MTLRGIDFTGLAYLVGFVIVGVVAYEVIVNRKKIATALNPADSENVVNQAATKIVQQVSGDKNQTLGGAIFDFFHPNAGLAPGETSPAPGIIKPAPASNDPWGDALRNAGQGDPTTMIGVGA